MTILFGVKWCEMVWDSSHNYSINTKMMSYKDSGIEEELLRLKKMHYKKEEEKSRRYVEATLKRFKDEKRITGKLLLLF